MEEGISGMDREDITATISATIEDHPVALAILFGSQATGTSHPASDIDIAIELADLRPGDAGYNDVFLGVSAALAEAFGTDNVDVVDVHSLSPEMARSVLTSGHLVAGDPARLERLRRQLPSVEEPTASVKDQFDERLRRIEELLG